MQAHNLLTIRDASVTGIGHQLGVLGQHAPRVPRLGLVGVPLLMAFRRRGLVDAHIQTACLGIDDDLVAVAHQTDRPALHGLGHDIANQKPVRTADASAVGDERDVLA